MNTPEVQGVVPGCPFCPTRRECACPDGPEKCPDNPNCPCDKTVCPCGNHRRDPEPPPGCLTRPLWLGLGAAAIVGLIVLIIAIVTSGDDDSKTTTTPVDSISVTTTPNSAAPTSTTPPANPAPPLGPDVATDADDILGGMNVFTPDYCSPVLPGMQKVDQLGGSPLVDPSLSIEAFCMRRATLDGSQVPMLVGDFLLVATVHDDPLDAVTNITYQPSIGLDFPGVANVVPNAEGEGILQVPVDTAGFGNSLNGWEEARFYSVPGFGPSAIYGYSFSQPGSRVTGFAIYSELVPADARVYLQSFGRQTAPGAIPTNSDPAASTLVIAGAAPCIGECMVAPGRFQVEANWATDPGVNAPGAEGSNGLFWFFSPDNVELVVKVLNACDTPGFGNYWVFAGSLTDVEVTISVTDTSSGDVRTYLNPLGRSFEPITDTGAFATCP